MNSNQPKLGCKRGFTLIELLVVVLIIGILVAVALPQYKLAVVKSRVATVLPMLKSISQANHAYYLANGTFTADVNKLDIALSGNCTVTSDGDVIGQVWKCGKEWIVDNSGGIWVAANYCPDNNQTFNTCALKREFQIQVFWSSEDGKYKNRCFAKNSSQFGEKVCNSLALH